MIKKTPSKTTKKSPLPTGYPQLLASLIFRMRAFFLAYEKVPQAVGQLKKLPIFNIPWGHNVCIVERVESPKERLWYAQETIINGWSRSLLETWIAKGLCKSKSKIKAEYALRDLRKPIGISDYETKLVESLPKKLKGSLPTVQEIEAELETKKKKKRRK